MAVVDQNGMDQGCVYVFQKPQNGCFGVFFPSLPRADGPSVIEMKGFIR